MARYALVGDVGGTNGRLSLLHADGLAPAARRDYLVRDHPNLASMLTGFLADASVQPAAVAVAVLAMCGPVWDGGRTNDHNNSHFRLTLAPDVEAATGLPPGCLTFVNDFVANGHALTLLHQPDAPATAVPTGLVPLHAAAPEPGAALACVGAGTGLGAVFMVPHPGPGGVVRHAVSSSEAGMTSTLCPQSDLEWRLLQHLRAQRQAADGAHVDVERVVSGPGLVAVYDFLRADAGLPAGPPATPEEVAEAARGGADPHAAAAVELFLHHYGRVLCVASLTFMPYGGLYIAGGILPKLAWAWAAQGLADGDGAGGRVAADPAGPLMRGFYEAGPPLLRGLVARTPLTLVTDGELGIKGCVAVAADRLRAAVA